MTPWRLDLAELIERLVAPHRAAAKIKGLRFAVELAPALSGAFVGDSAGLERALSPLLDNAVKFTDRGEVRLTVAPCAGGKIRFSCSDTGVGFDAASKEDLFIPFRQQDDGLTRRFGGLGLGLALAKQNALVLGGTIDASPREGGGSVFWLEIPLAPAPVVDPKGAETRLRILVADDHPTNRRIVELMLQSVADITLAEDGVEALDAAERETFDVILMDIQMPRMDGITAVSRIRAAERAAGQTRTPVIMLTANTQPENVAASRQAGADRHVGKPFTSASLLGEIQAVLSG